MTGEDKSLVGPLVASIAAITLAFSAVFLMSQLTTREIQQITHELSENSAPALHLGNMIALLWRLQIKALQARIRTDEGRPAQLDGVDETEDLAREWRRYTMTPPVSGELELRQRIVPDLTTAERDLTAVSDAFASGHRAHAIALLDREVPDAFERARDDLRNLDRYDIRHNGAHAIRAEELWRESNRTAMIMGGLALVLAVILAWTMVHSMQRLAGDRARRDRLAEEHFADSEMFAARVAHDLRGPLTAAHLACESVERGSAQALARVRSSLKRATSLVDDLYAFARAEIVSDTGGRTPLREAVRHAADDIQEAALAAGMSVLVKEIPECIVNAPAGVVGSVLSNLLSNAIKHAGSGARVTVRAKVEERVRVEVEDTGVGIPFEVQRRIFHPYVRGDSCGEGLGLGLATVRRLTERCGGACGVRSTPGKGSLFWFELPLIRDRSEDRKTGPLKHAPSAQPTSEVPLH